MTLKTFSRLQNKYGLLGRFVIIVDLFPTLLREFTSSTSIPPLICSSLGNERSCTAESQLDQPNLLISNVFCSFRAIMLSLGDNMVLYFKESGVNAN